MIKFTHKGDFSKVNKFLEKARNVVKLDDLDKYGQAGVDALSAATPTETGKTASSWYYTIERQNGKVSINYHNSNINNGVPIAIILQFGHATGTGGWVEGRDYINPAIQPIFDEIANNAWREVTRL